MFKFIFGLIKIFIFVVVLALIFHNYAARLGLSLFLKTSLGVAVSIETAQVDLLGSKAFFRNMVIHNPADFPEGYIAKIPYLLIDLDVAAFSDGRLHFNKIEVDVGDFHIMKTIEGDINWRHLKILGREDSDSKSRMKVDHFLVTLRKGTYRDLSRSGPPRVLILDVENQDYLGAHTLKDMVAVISWEALKRMGLERLGDGALDQIREDLDGAM